MFSGNSDGTPVDESPESMSCGDQGDSGIGEQSERTDSTDERLYPLPLTLGSNIVGYVFRDLVWVGEASAMPSPPVRYDIDAFRDIIVERLLTTGIHVRVHRDGLFVFDFSGWKQTALRPPMPGKRSDPYEVPLFRLQIMNAHLACIYMAIIRDKGPTFAKTLIRPQGLLIFNGDGEVTGNKDAYERVLAFARGNDASFDSLPKHVASELVPYRALGITREALELSFLMLEDLLARHVHLRKKATSPLIYAEMLLRACIQCEEHSYSLSLVTAWTVIEKLLVSLWNAYIAENQQREVDGRMEDFIDEPRRERLANGRDYSAAIVIEILSLTGELPMWVYGQLTTIRRARNAWIHELKSVPGEAAILAIRTAYTMLKRVEGMELYLRPSVSWDSSGSCRKYLVILQTEVLLPTRASCT